MSDDYDPKSIYDDIPRLIADVKEGIAYWEQLLADEMARNDLWMENHIIKTWFGFGERFFTEKEKAAFKKDRAQVIFVSYDNRYYETFSWERMYTIYLSQLRNFLEMLEMNPSRVIVPEQLVSKIYAYRNP